MENNISEPSDNRKKIDSPQNVHNYINFETTLQQIYLKQNDKNQKYQSKCNSLTLDFRDLPYDVGEITFTNYYTYTVSVLIMKKISYTDSNGLKKWFIAIKEKVFK